MRIYWLINGNVTNDPMYGPYDDLASNRLRCLIPANVLADKGYDVRVVTKPEHALDIKTDDVVIVGKLFNDQYNNTVYNAAEVGARVFLDFCDPVWEREPYPDLRDLSNYRVFASQGLRAVYPGRDTQSCVIPDPFELQPASCAKPTRDGSDFLWYGNVFNIDPLFRLVGEVEGQSFQLVTALNQELGNRLMSRESSNNLSFTPWSMQNMENAFRYSDGAVVIPHYKRKGYELKSSNRIVAALAAGRTVIMENAPQWDEFQEFTCATNSVAGSIWNEEWRNVRLRSVWDGHSYVLEKYSPLAIAKQWEDAINAN